MDFFVVTQRISARSTKTFLKNVFVDRLINDDNVSVNEIVDFINTDQLHYIKESDKDKLIAKVKSLTTISSSLKKLITISASSLLIVLLNALERNNSDSSMFSLILYSNCINNFSSN